MSQLDNQNKKTKNKNKDQNNIETQNNQTIEPKQETKAVKAKMGAGKKALIIGGTLAIVAGAGVGAAYPFLFKKNNKEEVEKTKTGNNPDTGNQGKPDDHKIVEEVTPVEEKAEPAILPKATFNNLPIDQHSVSFSLFSKMGEALFKALSESNIKELPATDFEDYIFNVYLPEHWTPGEEVKIVLTSKSNANANDNIEIGAKSIQGKDNPDMSYIETEWLNIQKDGIDNYLNQSQLDTLNKKLSSTVDKDYSSLLDLSKIVEQIVNDRSLVPSYNDAQVKKSFELLTSDFFAPNVPSGYDDKIGINVTKIINADANGIVDIELEAFIKNNYELCHRTFNRRIQLKSDSEIITTQDLINQFAQSFDKRNINFKNPAILKMLPSQIVASPTSVTNIANVAITNLIGRGRIKAAVIGVTRPIDATGHLSFQVEISKNDNSNAQPRTVTIDVAGFITAQEAKIEADKLSAQHEVERISSIMVSHKLSNVIDQVSLTPYDGTLDAKQLQTLGLNSLVTLNNNFTYHVNYAGLQQDGTLSFSITADKSGQASSVITGSTAITGINKAQAKAKAASITSEKVKAAILTKLGNHANIEPALNAIPTSVVVDGLNILVRSKTLDIYSGAVACDWSYTDATYQDVVANGTTSISGFKATKTPKQVVDDIQQKLDKLTSPMHVNNVSDIWPTSSITNSISSTITQFLDSQGIDNEGTTVSVKINSMHDGVINATITYNTFSLLSIMSATKTYDFNGWMTIAQKATLDLGKEQEKLNALTNLSLNINQGSFSIAQGSALTQDILTSFGVTQQMYKLNPNYTYTYETSRTITADGNTPLKLIVSKTGVTVDPNHAARNINLTVTGIDLYKRIQVAKAELADEQKRFDSLSGHYAPTIENSPAVNKAALTIDILEKFGIHNKTLDTTHFNYFYDLAGIRADGDFRFVIYVESKNRDLIGASLQKATPVAGTVTVTGVQEMINQRITESSISIEQARINGILLKNAGHLNLNVNVGTVPAQLDMNAATKSWFDSSLLTSLNLSNEYDYQLIPASIISQDGSSQIGIKVIDKIISGKKYTPHNPSTMQRYAFNISGISIFNVHQEIGRIKTQLVGQTPSVEYQYNEFDRAALSSATSPYGTVTFDPGHIQVPALSFTAFNATVSAKYQIDLGASILTSGLSYSYSHPVINSSGQTTVTIKVTQRNYSETYDVPVTVNNFEDAVKLIQQEELNAFCANHAAIERETSNFNVQKNWTLIKSTDLPYLGLQLPSDVTNYVFNTLKMNSIEARLEKEASGTSYFKFRVPNLSSVAAVASETKIAIAFTDVVQRNLDVEQERVNNLDHYDFFTSDGHSYAHSMELPTLTLPFGVLANNDKDYTAEVMKFSQYLQCGFGVKQHLFDFDNYIYKFVYKGSPEDTIRIKVFSRVNPNMHSNVAEKEIPVKYVASPDLTDDLITKLKNFYLSHQKAIIEMNNWGEAPQVNDKIFDDAAVRYSFPDLRDPAFAGIKWRMIIFRATDYTGSFTTYMVWGENAIGAPLIPFIDIDSTITNRAAVGQQAWKTYPVNFPILTHTIDKLYE